MEKVRKRLLAEFLIPIIICLVIVVLGEFNVVPTGVLSGNTQVEFVLLAAMEIITICVIPLALRLFRFGKIHSQLVEQRERGLQKWGTIRLEMLTVPMVVNTLLYYLTMNAAFGYLAIILFLCMFFVVPTQERCNAEIEK